MDNFHFDMTSTGASTLKAALALFNPPGGKVVGYNIVDNRMILFWANSPKATKLPFPMTLAQAGEFVAGWLEHAEYGKRPDHDGDNDKGWRLFTEIWGMIGGDHAAFAAIEPCWAMYGK